MLTESEKNLAKIGVCRLREWFSKHALTYHAPTYFISFCTVSTSSSITSSLPARISLATQPRIWLARSSRLKAFRAAPTAADCCKISLQYPSCSSMASIPRICPSIRRNRLIIARFCSGVRLVVFRLHPSQVETSLIFSLPPAGS